MSSLNQFSKTKRLLVNGGLASLAGRPGGLSILRPPRLLCLHISPVRDYSVCDDDYLYICLKEEEEENDDDDDGFSVTPFSRLCFLQFNPFFHRRVFFHPKKLSFFSHCIYHRFSVDNDFDYYYYYYYFITQIFYYRNHK